MRSSSLLLFVFVLVGGRVLAQELPPVREGPRLVEPREYRVGELLPDIAFTDIAGKAGKLSDYRGKTVVVAFATVECPLSKRYSPELVRIADDAARRGIEFLLVNPAEDETPEQIRQACIGYGLDCRVVHDPELQIALALGAEVTTDSFVIDGARTLQYRGSVDDRYGFGYALDTARSTYLRDAIDAVVAGQRPPVRATAGPGCELALPAAEPTPADTPITYHGRISRLIQHSCQSCHRPGEAGPFSLLTYKQVRGKRGTIRRALTSHFMPPWFATHGGPWANELTLSESERADFLRWIADDCPKGDPSDAPLERAWPEGWQIGEPNMVLELPREHRIPAEGTVPYRYSDVVARIEEDCWVQSMEIRPTSPEHVHHVLVFMEFPRDHPRAKEQRRYQGGLRGYFAGMVPGQNHLVFPEGSGRFLPAGARLQFQVHYTTNGTASTDRSKLGLIFTNGKPAEEIVTRGISNATFEIPAGAHRHEVTATTRLRKPGRIFGFGPHMHTRGTAFRFELLFPDGREEVVLDVPRFDFNWQLWYSLREPISVPAGTRIRATGWFDNSADNPANPAPNKRVFFGEQTWEEMMIGYFTWIEGVAPPPAPAKPDGTKRPAGGGEFF